MVREPRGRRGEAFPGTWRPDDKTRDGQRSFHCVARKHAFREFWDELLHGMSDSEDSDDLDWDPDRERALRKLDRAARERLTPQGPRKSIKERKAEYAQWKAARDMVAQASTVSFMAKAGAEAATRRHEEQLEQLEQQRQQERHGGSGDDEGEGEGEDSQSDWSEEEEPSGANANYDVVVVGAEPAGLLLALDLGRERLRVLLVEPNTEEPGDGPPLNLGPTHPSTDRLIDVFHVVECPVSGELSRR